MKLTLREKQSLYHELQQFLTSGIPMTQAVEALMPETSGSVRWLLSKMLEMLLAGESVPGTFARLQPTVSKLETSLIEASSNTGRLEQSFIYLANYFGALETVRDKTVRGLIWPAINIHIGVFVSNLVPFFLGAMTWNAYLFRCIGTLAVFYLAGALVWFGGVTLVAMGRKEVTVDWLLGRLPLIGKLRRNLSLSRFCATYEMQLQAGINVYDSLRSAADASQSARIDKLIANVLPKVRDGSSFGSTLAGQKALPAALERAIRLGEESGSLDENLRRWASYYQQAAVRALDTAGTLIPRIFYVVMAGYLIYSIIGGQMEQNKAIQQILDGGM